MIRYLKLRVMYAFTYLTQFKNYLNLKKIKTNNVDNRIRYCLNDYHIRFKYDTPSKIKRNNPKSLRSGRCLNRTD